MDGKKKFEARHLTPQCYHSTHTHVHTHGSCLETTGYNHTCQVKSVSNWPQTFMCLDLALLLLRNITSWTWFTVGTSLRFNLSACSCLELSQLSLAMRSPRDQALEQQVPLLSRTNPTMQFWPSAQCDFHHNAHPYNDYMSGNIASWHTWTQTWTPPSFQVNLILSSDHLMREFLIQLASESSLSDEPWQRHSLIFEPGDGV